VTEGAADASGDESADAATDAPGDALPLETGHGWNAETPMSNGRGELAASPVTIAGSAGVLAVGGIGGGWLATAEFFDPTSGQWLTEASMPTAREYLAAAPVTMGGAAGVLAVGGRSNVNLSVVEFYDPNSNAWSTEASLPTERVWLAAAPVTIGGVTGVLAIGGESNNNPYLASTEFFDPNANTWSAKASMPTARYGLAAAPITIGGVAGVLAIGGYNGSGTISTVEFYDPATDSWTANASLSAAAGSLAAAPIVIGGVAGILAVGGNDGTNPLDSAAFFNPNTNSWTMEPNLPTARFGLAAAPVTILGMPGVLTAGGCNATACAGALSIVEFFTP
jgi:hypothetical protein